MVKDGGAITHVNALIDSLNEHVAAAMPDIVAKIQKLVMLRTPSTDEEYAALMVGDGNPENVTLVPRGSDGSADTDLPRRRLVKDSGTYLEVINAMTSNVMTDAENLRFGVGYLPMLLKNTTYSYINVDGKKELHSVTKGPYFGAFEFGVVNVDNIPIKYGQNPVVEPRAMGRKNRRYPLLPSDVTDARGHYVDAKQTMKKPITPRYMYLNAYLKPEAWTLLEDCLEQFGPASFR